MDMTNTLCSHQLSLQAMYSGHYTTSIDCCKNINNGSKVNVNTKNASIAYVVIHQLITHGLERRRWDFSHSHRAGTSFYPIRRR